MKLIFLLTIVFIVFLNINAQEEIGLKFEGRVKNTKIQNDPYSDNTIDIYVNLDMSILNKGSKSLIFPTRLINCYKVNLLKSNGENISVVRPPGNSYLPEWNKIIERFDKNKPPKKHTKIVKSASNWSFNYFFTLTIPATKSNSKSVSDDDSIVIMEDISYSALKEISPVFLQLVCSVKPSVKPNDDSSDFWKTLKYKWNDFGYLWIDEITSEAIQLDLIAR